MCYVVRCRILLSKRTLVSTDLHGTAAAHARCVQCTHPRHRVTVFLVAVLRGFLHCEAPFSTLYYNTCPSSEKTNVLTKHGHQKNPTFSTPKITAPPFGLEATGRNFGVSPTGGRGFPGDVVLPYLVNALASRSTENVMIWAFSSSDLRSQMLRYLNKSGNNTSL